MHSELRSFLPAAHLCAEVEGCTAGLVVPQRGQLGRLYAVPVDGFQPSDKAVARHLQRGNEIIKWASLGPLVPCAEWSETRRAGSTIADLHSCVCIASFKATDDNLPSRVSSPTALACSQLRSPHTLLGAHPTPGPQVA